MIVFGVFEFEWLVYGKMVDSFYGVIFFILYFWFGGLSMFDLLSVFKFSGGVTVVFRVAM